MARCCSSGCSCKVEGGLNIAVTGIGSSGDPFVVSADLAMIAVDTDVFNMTISGAGTILSPFAISTAYSATAKLDDIPDVNAPAPTNGQVIGWDTATSKWTARGPTTAAAGSVSHDTSLSGDGSAGSPLQVAEATGGYLATSATGLGLTDTAKNLMIRKFADAAARTATTVAPTLNSQSMLDTAPGRIDYWTGTQWLPVDGPVAVDGVASGVGQQLLALSGEYVAGRPVTMMVRNFSGTTGADGRLTVIANSSITGRAGVLTALVTVTGAQPYLPVLAAGSDYLYLTARRVDDGTVLIGQAISGQVTAYIY